RARPGGRARRWHRVPRRALRTRVGTSTNTGDAVITGAGAVCAVGTGCAALAEALATGRDGIRPVERFSVAEFVTRVAGLWPGLAGGGVAELVVAGGAAVLTREVFAGFHALGALSPGKCAPFGVPPGTSMGEGAGFVIVEAAEQARARGARTLAHVLGYGLSA